MREIWKKNKLILTIAGFALAFSVVIYFLAFPLIEKIKMTSQKIQEKIADNKIEDEKLGNLPQMEKDWEDFKEQKKITEVILSPGNEVSFIESIDLMAQKSGNIIDLKIGDQVDPKEIEKIKSDAKKNKEQKSIMNEIEYSSYFPMQINLQGDYKGLLNFIHMLESGHFYVNIISINSNKQIEKSLSEENMFSQKNDDKKDKNSKEFILSSISAIIYTQKQ